LLSPQWLLEDGLLAPQDLEPPPFSPYTTEYAEVRQYKTRLLHLAFARFAGKDSLSAQHTLASTKSFAPPLPGSTIMPCT
jgi:hypothetical protein